MKKYASGHGFSLCSLAYFHKFKNIVYGFLNMYPPFHISLYWRR